MMNEPVVSYNDTRIVQYVNICSKFSFDGPQRSSRVIHHFLLIGLFSLSVHLFCFPLTQRI